VTVRRSPRELPTNSCTGTGTGTRTTQKYEDAV
jgi:hypothetical protein